jgi:cytochrome P450
VSEVTAGRPVTAAGADAFARLRAAVTRTLGCSDAPSLLRETARAPEGLSHDEVASNAAVLMFGGIETTEGMILNAVRHLLGDAGMLPLVRDHADLLPNAIEESIRLEPAAAVVDRYATRDIELGGSRIQCGDLVSVSIAGANRDPVVFSDPDRFDIRRANAKLNLAFAQGPHFCLGAQLARTETTIAVGRLLDRLPGLRLDPDYPNAPRGLVFRKPPTLQVRWTV